jgi:hypothetical protein
MAAPALVALVLACGAGLADAMVISTAKEITVNNEPLIKFLDRFLDRFLRIDAQLLLCWKTRHLNPNSLVRMKKESSLRGAGVMDGWDVRTVSPGIFRSARKNYRRG